MKAVSAFMRWTKDATQVSLVLESGCSLLRPSPSHTGISDQRKLPRALIPRAGVNESFRFAVAAPLRAGHQRPDKLEVHVEICRDFPSSRRPKTAPRAFIVGSLTNVRV